MLASAALPASAGRRGLTKYSADHACLVAGETVIDWREFVMTVVRGRRGLRELPRLEPPGQTTGRPP